MSLLYVSGDLSSPNFIGLQAHILISLDSSHALRMYVHEYMRRNYNLVHFQLSKALFLKPQIHPKMRIKVFKFVLSIVFSFSYCSAANTITQGQSIKDGLGQILTSPAEFFALGFFSPKNSSNRYVGIWYNKISEQTVVWVANRNSPITNSSGVLAFGNDGNLQVLDGSGKSLWSSNISSVNANRNVTAFLMDSGNLVLSLNDKVDYPDVEKALWQSFDDPTDIYLPGKKVWLSPKSSKDIFVCWKSESDPSPGNFSMGVNPQGFMEIMAWEGLKRRWRSGLWNGHSFIGVPDMPTTNYLFGYRVDKTAGGRTFFNYVVQNSSDIIQFRMKWDGTVEPLLWDEEKREWKRLFAWPTRPCEIYNTCGQFGSCSGSSKPICSCIPGFEPKSNREWDNGNWTGGCVRRTQLLCDGNFTSGGEVKADEFLELHRLHLPDFSSSIESNGKDDCRSICLNNCSCIAYSYVDGIQCLTWSGDLLDVQKFQIGGQPLYVRLAASELPDRKRKVILQIILVVVVGIVLLGISIFIFILWRYRAKLRGIFRKEKSQAKRMDECREFWCEQSDGGHKKGNGSELKQHSFQEIVDATNSFSSANKLGEGGFGPVYKGDLACGKRVAVKRLSTTSGQGMEEFKNELILIAKLQHRNLVRLVGYCIEGEEKLLIYEYMPNKSLDTFVFGNPQEHLDWGRRFCIVEGIARGLLYLHRDSRSRIIHRDLKVSNILLDQEMTPKISDFGMAKIFGGNEDGANTVRVVGTYGYMSPEYAMEGLFSVKSDVYSFGVLLLEIISGKKNKFFHTENSTSLIGYAWILWCEDRTMEFIDPSIRDSCSQADAVRCIHIGLLCVQDSPTYRPVMSTVVLMLESDTDTLPAPRRPMFTVTSNRMETKLSLGSSNAHSINNVTSSMVVGR